MKFTCACCYDEEVTINQAVACDNSHIACTECLSRAVNIAVAENNVVRCFTSDCGKVYSDTVVNCAFPFDEVIKKTYSVILHRHAIKEAEIANLYSCPFCDNGVIIEDQQAQFFRCNGCSKESCRNCRQEKHEGVCMERHSREEEETDKFLITCDCGLRIFRGDGCNKVQCDQCRKLWCWICKARLGRNPYEHFSDRNLGGVCSLYGERPENQVFVEVARPAIVRNHIERVGYLGNGVVGVGVDAEVCPGAPQQQEPQRRRRGGGAVRAPPRRHICVWTKRDGLRCNYKVHGANAVCGKHRAAARRANMLRGILEQGL